MFFSYAPGGKIDRRNRMTRQPHDRPTSSLQTPHALVLAGIIAAVSLLAYLARPLYRDVYFGIPPSIPVSTIVASCDADVGSTSCGANLIALNRGRFRLATSVPAARVTARIDDPSVIAKARFLLVRASVAGWVAVEGDGIQGPSAILSSDLAPGGHRYVIGIPASAWTRVTFTPAPSPAPVVIDELGFFESQSGLLRSEEQPFPRIASKVFYTVYAPTATVGLCGSIVIAAWFLPTLMLNRVSPWLAGILCAAICILELGMTFSPYWSEDLRSFYASTLQIGPSDGNLTGGLFEGSRLLQGLGETVPPGIVQWHRMPGYGLFCAIAAAIGRTTNVLEIAMIVIVLQVLLYSVAVGVFVHTAQRLLTPWMAWLLGVLIALLPKQLGYTQVDSIIVPIALIVLAALAVHLAAAQDGRDAALKHFLLVNLAFALWFVMRNDVLPGWVVVSLVLARRRWRYLVVPAVLISAIALSWALYKRQYSHELALMPTNTGEVMFLSLCEAPGAFPFECTDGGYFAWARQRLGRSDVASLTSKTTNQLAVAEVLRHWATYPIHFAFMVSVKLRRAVHSESWPGFQTRFNRLYGLARAGGLFVLLLAVVAVSLAVNHQRTRSFLLGWVLFLNMPLFFVVFSSGGRFYSAAGVSLVVAAAPLLFERGFYTQMARYPWRVAAVAACAAAFVMAGPRVEDLIRANDSVHYWTPLLDPGQSSLRFSSH